MHGIVQTLINALLVGGVYALLAVGQTMIFGVLKIINFAQGEFLMLAMYLCWAMNAALGSSVSTYLLVFPVTALMFVIGGVIMRVLVMPLLGRNDNNSYILLTIGLSYFLQNLAQALWSSNVRSVNSPIKTASFAIGGYIVPLAKLIAFCGALIFVIFIFWMLKNTDLGRAIRATSENRQTAQLLGVNYRKMYVVAFAIGAAVAGCAACLMIPIYSVYPLVGQTFSTLTFAVCVLGGLGNLKGAFAAGILIGIIETFTATYFNSSISQIAVFLVFIVVMLVRPNGIFGNAGGKL